MLLFHTDNLPHYGLERIFKFVSKAGYDGIEIGINNNFDTQNVAYLKDLEHRYQVPIKAFSITPKFEESLTEVFQHTVREFEGVRLNLSTPSALAFEYKKWLNDLVPRLAKKYELDFCRRNVPSETMMGFLPGRADNSLFALKRAGNVCLDLTALALSDDEVMKAVQGLGESLKHVYLSNLYHKQPYSLPMQGVLPLESVLSKLARSNFKGSFTVYVHGKHLSEGNDEAVLKKMEDIKTFFEEYFNLKST